MQTGDTITAISSAVGPAARIILRLSGSSAHDIARSLAPEAPLEPASAAHTPLVFAGLTCPAWLYAFRSPHSYTGEDLIEIHVPGSPVLAKLLLDDLLHRGARLAEPGEFTARAYFAGKIDLTEAEGVAATIAASNQDELNAARQLLAGELARRLRPATDLIAETLALVEVGIDFSEEDVTFLPADEIRRRVDEIDSTLATLLSESTRFERLAHEPRIVFVGRPNAGKSTLINALTGHQRSVVSDVAGTTRDVLSAPLALPRGIVQLVDIAGLGASTDATVTGEIELQMRVHALREMESADHVVLVRDVADNESPLDVGRPQDLTVISKIDLSDNGPRSDSNHLGVSARTGAGMSDLREALDHLAFGAAGPGVSLALNRRHVACIEDARAALRRVPGRVDDGAAELIALELREALDALGRILGSVTPDDVLGRIFSSFCIGK